MNNNVIGVVVGIIILVIGFLIIGAMNDDPVGVPDTNPSTSTSGAQTEAERQREADFQAERAASEAEANEVAFSINVSTLPEAQQVALAAMGISSTSSIDITNAMVACASVDMSETRMAEIQDGATVTGAEGIRLMSCYNANN